MRIKKQKLVISVMVLGLALITPTVFANQNPRGLATDNRIKVVAYNPNDVVTVVGSHLIATGIQFSPEELIRSVVNGDSVAWTPTVDKSTPNILYIKPILPSSNTNMTVITSKHRYVFHLMTRQKDNITSSNATYLLEFKYPEEERARLEGELSNLQKTFLGNVPGNPVMWNYNYSFYGNKTIAPLQAVDNGTFTVFKFPEHAPIPAIFAVDSHKNEALVNFRVQGNFVFIQGVRRLYTLRNGADVVSIYNDTIKI